MKYLITLVLTNFFAIYTNAQGCSDAGVCTIGDFHNRNSTVTKKGYHKNELDLVYTVSSHGKNEKFYQPQINYRNFRSSRTYIEARLPINSATDKAINKSITGLGDAIVSWNSFFKAGKKNNIKYTLGLRISLTDAAAKNATATTSYPMTLQTGLGSTDLLAAISYDVVKYLTISGGIQTPIINYNKNSILINTGTGFVTGKEYHRKSDALVKLTGKFSSHKFKANASLINIFHLADDYYKTTSSKYTLTGSKGLTVDAALELLYGISPKTKIGVTFAQPLKTRKVIPDGLARSQVIIPKITFAF